MLCEEQIDVVLFIAIVLRLGWFKLRVITFKDTYIMSILVGRNTCRAVKLHFVCNE